MLVGWPELLGGGRKYRIFDDTKGEESIVGKEPSLSIHRAGEREPGPMAHECQGKKLFGNVIFFSEKQGFGCVEERASSNPHS